MKRVIVISMICLMLAVSASSVNANTVRQDCGCGLGAIAIGEKEGLLWNLLGTCLNGFSGNQTFAMSSGTLDCGEMTTFAKLDKMNKFVAENMDSLAVDISMGQGESLDALAEIAQVPDSKRSTLYSSLQNNFDSIYTDAEVTHKAVVNKVNEIIETI